MPKNYDAHENTYIVRDEKGNVKSIAPCYAEEEDSIVVAAREYEKEQKAKKAKEEEPER